MIARIYQVYLLPGLVFQGAVIGGGYATGRELVEFFMQGGPLHGLLGMFVTALIWSSVMAVSFELCRANRTYDYRRFFRNLIGRYWILYEVLLLATMTLALGVIGAATGEILLGYFGLHEAFGTLALLVAIGTLVFSGTRWIERFMGSWSILLYAGYLFLIVRSLALFGDNVAAGLAASDGAGPWVLDGVRYAGYNVAAVPVVFFCLRHLTRRREALSAGLLGGLIAILPAILFYVAMLADYPAIRDASIPSIALLGKLDVPAFAVAFQVLLLGTFVQTGVALVHTVNERIAETLREQGRSMNRYSRLATAVGILFVALVLATQFGIITLVAKGYGMITWGFIIVFVLPTMTIGAWRVLIARQVVAG